MAVLRTVKPEKAKEMPFIFLLLLALQSVSTFLSDTKLISSIGNNVGVFEATALLLLAGTLIYFYKHNLSLLSHPLIILLGLWFTVALTSLINVQTNNLIASVPAVITVLFHFAFTFLLFNLLAAYPSSLRYVLCFLTIGAAIMGAWVFVEQVFLSPGDYNAAGGFRNRSHAGIYMMAAFWIVLVYRFWPGIKTWEKVVAYAALAAASYTIAASLRQSVYVAMIIGVIALGLSFLVIRGRQRFNLTLMVGFLSLLILTLYAVDDQSLTQLQLFKIEAATIEERFGLALAAQDDPEFDESFVAQQRQGAFQAFFDHPVLGIGWMGFYQSEYSPTGHELHSSPLRFIAELGVFGIAIYLSFLAIVFSRAAKMFVKARGTPYQLAALVMLIALGAEVISHLYNRMFTDRPYWFLLVIFLTVEYLVEQHYREHAPKAVRPLPGALPAFQRKVRSVEY